MDETTILQALRKQIQNIQSTAASLTLGDPGAAEIDGLTDIAPPKRADDFDDSEVACKLDDLRNRIADIGCMFEDMCCQLSDLGCQLDDLGSQMDDTKAAAEGNKE